MSPNTFTVLQSIFFTVHLFSAAGVIITFNVWYVRKTGKIFFFLASYDEFIKLENSGKILALFAGYLVVHMHLFIFFMVGEAIFLQ